MTMMKKKMMMMKSFCAVMSLQVLAACSDHDDVNKVIDPDGDGSGHGPLTTVNFELSADAASAGTLTKALPAPVYGKEGFRILAFKQDESGATENYFYLMDIPVSAMQYADHMLSGQVQVPIGAYKFIAMYGAGDASVLTMPALGPTSALGADLVMTHAADAVLPSIFLDDNALDAVPSYELGLSKSGSRSTVTTHISRAVGRVDVLFVRTDAAHTPIAGDDVFGPGIKNLTFEFSNVKNTIDLTGHATGGSMTHRYAIDFPNDAQTKGNGSAMQLGEEGYRTYDNVEAGHIIAGSSHISGAYLIPESDETHTVQMKMVLTSTSGATRTLPIATPIPLKRNYVTLIKVYVMGDDVFTTGSDFAVDIDPTWAGSIGAEVEVK